MDNLKNVKKYKKHIFSTGSYTGGDFQHFHKVMNEAIEEELAGFTVHTDDCKHYYWTCFAQNNETGKIVYISISDVRYSKNWYEQVLIRTANGLTDYKGGPNNYCSLEDVLNKALALTK